MKTITLVIMFAVVALFAGCSKSPHLAANADDPKVEGQTVAFPANSAQLGTLAVEEARSAPAPVARFAGRVVWDDNVTTRVYSPFGGRVTRLTVDAGDAVSTNATLALVASPDFGQAQADARRAAGDFQLAARSLNRVRELFDHGAAAQKDLQVAEADFTRAKSEQERAGSRVRFYGGADGGDVDQLFHLTSPVTGIVVERGVNPGQEVRADSILANNDKLSAPLFVVTDPARVWVLVDLAEQDLGVLKPGQPITVRSRALPGETFAGTIEKVASSLDLATRMVRVRAAVANPDHRLKAEMLVSVELPDATPGGIEVPTKAVFMKGESHFVYREESPGRFSRQPVKVGVEHGGRIVVTDGLKSGERIVSDGCLLLEQIREGAGA